MRQEQRWGEEDKHGWERRWGEEEEEDEHEGESELESGGCHGDGEALSVQGVCAPRPATHTHARTHT